MDVMCDHARLGNGAPNHMDPIEIFDFSAIEGRGYAWHCPVCDVRVCIRLNIDGDDE